MNCRRSTSVSTKTLYIVASALLAVALMFGTTYILTQIQIAHGFDSAFQTSIGSHTLGFVPETCQFCLSLHNLADRYSDHNPKFAVKTRQAADQIMRDMVKAIEVRDKLLQEKGLDQPRTGDPLMWDSPITEKVWLEQYEAPHPGFQHKYWFVDLDQDGYYEKIDRDIIQGKMMFFDWDGNGYPNTSGEIMYESSGLISYDILEQMDVSENPLYHKNGFYDKNDIHWDKVMVVSYHDSHVKYIQSATEEGIYGFGYKYAEIIKDDCFGLGGYSDFPDGYAQETKVDKEGFEWCKAKGGFDHMRKYADTHFRMKGINEQYGVLYEDGSKYISYAVVIGEAH